MRSSIAHCAKKWSVSVSNIENIKLIAEGLGLKINYITEVGASLKSFERNKCCGDLLFHSFNPYESSSDAFMVQEDLLAKNSDVTLVQQGKYFIVYVLTYDGIKFSGDGETINIAIVNAWLSLNKG